MAGVDTENEFFTSSQGVSTFVGVPWLSTLARKKGTKPSTATSDADSFPKSLLASAAFFVSFLSTTERFFPPAEELVLSFLRDPDFLSTAGFCSRCRRRCCLPRLLSPSRPLALRQYSDIGHSPRTPRCCYSSSADRRPHTSDAVATTLHARSCPRTAHR